MYPNDRGSGSGTAFRVAEKRYQLHKEELYKEKNGRRRRKGFIVRPTDLSDVVDLQTGAHYAGVTCLGGPSGMPPNAAAYSFAAHPGLLVVCGALEPALQRQLVVDALTKFCEPPNHTNHSKSYLQGLPGMWAAVQQGLRLQPATTAQQQQQEEQQAVTSEQQQHQVQPEAGNIEQQKAQALLTGNLWGPGGSGPIAESLLRKLRWATLGPPYDWTRRLYLRHVPHMPLPAELRQLAVSLASLASDLLGRSGGQHPHASDAGCMTGLSGQQAQGAPYCPDAALVNFYYEGDTLNGHIDDAERSLSQPLVSLSLGCDAIFLIGGTTKDVAPTALLLHSGDAVVLSGPARRCYHGLPRVLTDRPLPDALRCSGSSGCDGPDCLSTSSRHDGGNRGADCADESFHPFERWMQGCRINISIRDIR